MLSLAIINRWRGFVLNFGVRGGISLKAKFGKAQSTASWSQIVDIKSMAPSPYALPPYQALNHAVVESFRSYYNEQSAPLYMTRIYLDDTSDSYVDVRVPIAAMHFAMNAMARQAFADDLERGEVAQDAGAAFVFDLTVEGVEAMEANYKHHRGIFKSYDYYLSPLMSVEMCSPAEVRAAQVERELG